MLACTFPANNCPLLLIFFFFFFARTSECHSHFYLTLPDTFKMSLVLKNSLQEITIIVHTETPSKSKVLIIEQEKITRPEKWHIQCQKKKTHSYKVYTYCMITADFQCVLNQRKQLKCDTQTAQSQIFFSLISHLCVRVWL